MKLRWKSLLVALGIVGLLAGGWFGYGAYEANRFEERLAAMYADGSLRTFAHLQGEPIPDSENGWALLMEADALREEVERRISMELAEANTETLEFPPEDRAEWTPEQIAHEKRVLRELAPTFSRLDEALQRSRLAYLGTPPVDSGAFVWVLFACQRWLRRMRMEPERYPQDVDRIVRLFDRWEARDGVDAGIRTVMWRSFVLTALREGLERGHIDGTRRPWSHSLEHEEAQVLAGAALTDAWKRSTLVWLMQDWRRGVDPLAPMRAEVGKLTPFFSFLDDDDSAVGRLGALMRQASTAHPPWYIAWYGRPWMQRDANRALDALEAEPPRPFTLARVRADVQSPDETAAHEARNILRTLTGLRLARVALAVRGAIENGMGKPVDLRVGVAARLGGQHLHDPLSQKLFVMRVREDHVVIHVRPSDALNALNADFKTLEGAAREKQMYEDLLLWRVPKP